MSQTYTYLISDFPNNKVFLDTLESQIKASNITIALDGMISNDSECVITFKTAISGGEKTTLDSIVAAHDGIIVYSPSLVKIDSSTPVSIANTDFPKDSQGTPKMSQYFPALGMIPCWRGYQFDANIGQTTFYDIEVWDYIRVASGIGWVSGMTPNDWDDYIEFSVVDKNDVLGLFSTYNLTVGQDVLEIKKFLKNEYPRKGSESNEFKLDMTLSGVLADPVLPGLFFRIAYVCDPKDHQSGETGPHIIIRLHYYEG